MVSVFIVGFFYQMYRYMRVSSAWERKQTTWVLISVLGMSISWAIYHIIPLTQPAVNFLCISRLLILFVGHSKNYFSIGVFPSSSYLV